MEKTDEQIETVLDDQPKKMFFVIQVSSAGFYQGNYAFIKLDGLPITMEPNESGHFRGLHIVIINPLTGDIEAGKVFDTYKSSAMINLFIKGNFKKGCIVAAACRDECSNALSTEVKTWFASMGSRLIWQLQYREAFAFIGTFGTTSELYE